MLMSIIDAESNQQVIVVGSVETTTDSSGSISESSEWQVALDANTDRSGFLIQNKGSNDMQVNDTAQATGSAFLLQPGDFWPPAGYPVNTSAVYIYGTAEDTYLAREW